VSSRPDLPLFQRRALHLEAVDWIARWEEKEGRRGGQTALHRLTGLSQPAINKVANGPDVGPEVAEKLLQVFGCAVDELVRRHRTMTTAMDVLETINRYPALKETIEREPQRWSAERLVEVVVEVQKSPPNATAGGRLVGSSWREILDGASKQTARTGGSARARKQIQSGRHTP
jgi:hypothetical protein